jgi:CheY-like chemotaxis protein
MLDLSDNPLPMPEAQKLKIFLVDDDRFLLDMYSLKFSHNGFDVTALNGPTEALAKLREGAAPDIMMVDLVMPVMDGVELLGKAKEEGLVKNAILIILTNQGQQSDIDRAKEAGVHGYIVKASTIPSEVLAEVRKIYDANHKK